MSNNCAVTKAVIPVAGLGTRFLPVTRTVPKVLLPVLNVPIIEYAVREAAAAGVTDIALIVSQGMQHVTEYFRSQPVLEAALELRGEDELLEQQREISSLARVTAIYQEQPRGLGHAILMSREFCNGEPFAVILPDDLVLSRRPAIEQLLEVRNRYGGSVIAASEVTDEVVPTKGIIGGDFVEPRVVAVSQMVEKPAVEEAPSNLSIVGRYVLENDVFEFLSQEVPGAGGEIQLTDAIESKMDSMPVHACVLDGHHVDTGNPWGMLEASLHVAGRDPDLRQKALALLESWRSQDLRA